MAYLTMQLLTTSLTGATWTSDRAKMASYSKDISDVCPSHNRSADSQKVKSRMIELEPRGFKYVVTTTLTENLGQAGRADMSCHWEDSDLAVQEIFSNVRAPLSLTRGPIPTPGLYNSRLRRTRHQSHITTLLLTQTYASLIHKSDDNNQRIAPERNETPTQTDSCKNLHHLDP